MSSAEKVVTQPKNRGNLPNDGVASRGCPHGAGMG